MPHVFLNNRPRPRVSAARRVSRARSPSAPFPGHPVGYLPLPGDCGRACKIGLHVNLMIADEKRAGGAARRGAKSDKYASRYLSWPDRINAGAHLWEI